MTKVRVLTNNLNYVRMSVEGHADTSNVCAGISAICYALSGFCENNRSHLEFLSHTENSGNYLITVKGDEVINAAFEMAVIGLMQIEKSHPDELKVSVA